MEEKILDLLTNMSTDIKEMKTDIVVIKKEQEEIKANVSNIQLELGKVKKAQNRIKKVVNSLKSSQSVIVNNLLFVRDIQDKMQGDLSMTKENVTKILEAQNEKGNVLKLKLVK